MTPRHACPRPLSAPLSFQHSCVHRVTKTTRCPHPCRGPLEAFLAPHNVVAEGSRCTMPTPRKAATPRTATTPDTDIDNEIPPASCARPASGTWARRAAAPPTPWRPARPAKRPAARPDGCYDTMTSRRACGRSRESNEASGVSDRGFNVGVRPRSACVIRQGMWVISRGERSSWRRRIGRKVMQHMQTASQCVDDATQGLVAGISKVRRQGGASFRRGEAIHSRA